MKSKPTPPKVPLLWTGGFFLLFLILVFINYSPPVLESVYPLIASPGEMVVIKGRNFGSEQGMSSLVIGGHRATRSYLRQWSDKEIRLVLPPGIQSGQIKVVTMKGESQGILFANQQELPVAFGDPVPQGAPLIQEITPQRGRIGELITIKGENFGDLVSASAVIFSRESWDAGAPSTVISEEPGILTPSEKIELWTNREIQVRIPTGASSGNIKARSGRGESNPVYFEVEDIGQRVLSNPRNYSVTIRADVVVQEGVRPNKLNLWVPRPREDFILRGLHYFPGPQKPILENYSHMDVFSFENLLSGETRSLSLDLAFRVYQYEVSLLPDEVRPFPSRDSSFYKIYTLGDYLVPVDHPLIEEVLTARIGKINNPYDQARRIFDYLLEGVFTIGYSNRTDPIELLRSGRGNSKEISLAYVALLRKAGIPARPVSGYLMDRAQRFHPHFWAEVYFVGVGWFPVDLALADGVNYPGVPLVSNPQTYYFGNIDNSHVPISKGISHARQMDFDGVTSHENFPISYQTITSESIGNLENYSVIWHDMKVTGN